MTKIAIADDHKVFLTSLGTLLDSYPDFEVILYATNGRELIDKISPGRMPDIILIDMEMDGLDGLETISILLEQYKDSFKIIVLSMHTEEKIIEEALERGAHGFVSKSVEADELIRIIEKVNHSGYYLEPDITRYLVNKLYGKNRNNQAGNFENLNDKEIEILKLICDEHSTKEIAQMTKLTVHTVNTYRKNLIAKTDSKNVVGLVMYAIRKGYYLP